MSEGISIVDNCQQMLTLLEKHKFYIYGTGYVARRFYFALKKFGYGDHIIGFVTKMAQEGIDGQINIPVGQLKMEAGTILCIGVHKSLVPEIIKDLKEYGITQYLWIYPFLHDFIMGEPIQKKLQIPLSKIWQVKINQYSFVARILAVDQYYGKNDCGYEIYKKAISFYSNVHTAQKRLEKFQRLINFWENNGYDDSKAILLLDNYNMIDGAHRTALAIYHGMKNISCNIYEAENQLIPIHENEAYIDEDNWRGFGITDEEFSLMQNKKYDIDKIYF